MHMKVMYLGCIILIFVILASIDNAYAESGDWYDDRGDVNNSGYQNSTGVIDELKESYRLTEVGVINFQPLVVDLSGDGTNEIVYAKRDGTIVIRDGRDGSIIDTTNINPVISTPISVFDVNNDGYLDLLVTNTSDDLSILHILDGSTLELITRIPMNGEQMCDGKIFDVDSDGNFEIVIPLYEGSIYCIDLVTLSIDWVEYVHEALRLPVGIFLSEGVPKIAVTTGITERGHPIIYTYGSKNLFVLDGSTGEIDVEFEPGSNIICTPPTIFTHQDDIMIAFGSATGDAFIYNYDDQSLFYRLSKDDLERNPYWKYFDHVFSEGLEPPYMILQGSKGCTGLNLNTKQLDWEEYYRYDNSKITSVCCDINNDGQVELLLLGETFTIRNITNGNIINNYTEDEFAYYGLLTCDIDNDDFLEIILFSSSKILALDGLPYIRFKDTLFGNKRITEYDEVIQYAMYERYSLESIIEMSGNTRTISRLSITMDPDGIAITASYEPNSGKVTTDKPDLLIIEQFNINGLARNYLMTFDYFINWSFPHEDFYDVRIQVQFLDGFKNNTRLPSVFRVENDIQFSGELWGMQNGSIKSLEQWFIGSLPVNFSGLVVTYEDTIDTYVNDSYIEITGSIGSMDIILDYRTGFEILFVHDFTSYPTGTYNLTMRFSDFPLGISARPYHDNVLIDRDPVEILEVFPRQDGFLSTGDLSIGMVASDSNGSGINLSSVQCKIEMEGKFGESLSWLGFSEYEIIMNDIYTFILFSSLDNGIYLFQWRAKDVAGNDYSYSIPQQLKIDQIGIEFSDPYPLTWQNLSSVSTGISIGILSNTSLSDAQIQYAYSQERNTMTEWIDYELIGSRDQILTTIIRDFNEGIHNYLKWRVLINETVQYYSESYQIRIDTTPPEIGQPIPDLGNTFDSGNIIIKIPISDSLSGLDLDTLVYRYSYERNNFIGQWKRCNSTMEDGTDLALIEFTNLMGKENYFIIQVLDIAGNPSTSASDINIKINEEPVIVTVSPPNNTKFEYGEKISFSIAYLEPDSNDTVSITWISSVDGTFGNHSELSVDNLSIGHHVITVIIDDNHGHIVQYPIEISIVDKQDNDEEPPTYFTRINIIIIVVVITVSLISIYYVNRINKEK